MFFGTKDLSRLTKKVGVLQPICNKACASTGVCVVVKDEVFFLTKGFLCVNQTSHSTLTRRGDPQC